MLKLAIRLSKNKAHRLEQGPLVLGYHRIYIMPNKLGVIFTAVVFTMLFGSINYNNALGYALSFLLIGIGVVSILHTYMNLSNLVIEPGQSIPVHAGDMVQFSVYLHSKTNNKYAIKLQNEFGSDLIDASTLDKSKVILRKPSTQRGWLELGQFKVSTSYPFGILTAWAWVDLKCTALVYPKIESKQTPIELSSAQKTTIRRTHTNRNDDFMGFRTYQAGDSPKHLYWKYFSANEVLLTKQFAGGGEDDVWLNFETVRDLPLELALSRLTRWVIECEKQRKKYGLILGSVTVKPGQGQAHQNQCLHHLALCRVS